VLRVLGAAALDDGPIKEDALRCTVDSEGLHQITHRCEWSAEATCVLTAQSYITTAIMVVYLASRTTQAGSNGVGLSEQARGFGMPSAHKVQRSEQHSGVNALGGPERVAYVCVERVEGAAHALTLSWHERCGATCMRRELTLALTCSCLAAAHGAAHLAAVLLWWLGRLNIWGAIEGQHRRARPQ
jgi:hypothetical protein